MQVRARMLYSPQQIARRVQELSSDITSDLGGRRPLLIAVLKGSVTFLSDLVRQMDTDPDVDFMSVSSYSGSSEPSGVVRIVKDLEESLEGRDVIVVEDIVDTGLTLSYLLSTLETRGPRSLRVCALINKDVRRIADTPLDYVGFETEEFLIGYGLDFKGRYRHLPSLMAVQDLAALAANPDGLSESLWGDKTAPHG